MSRYVRAFWCLSSNFGDALAPWLIQKIAKKPAVFTEILEKCSKYVVTGSILNWCDESCIAWGAGLANKTDRVNPRANICAVRGPLTREIVIQSGGTCPEVYGDPALLIPEFYSPRPAPTSRVGIIPHYVDQARAYDLSMPGKIINVIGPIENFIDEVCSCECIISSSLHGLIAAHAFGIPAAWIQFSDKVLGDGTKFLDHLATVGIKQDNPIKIEQIASCFDRHVETLIVSGKPTADLAKIRSGLLTACPFVT